MTPLRREQSFGPSKVQELGKSERTLTNWAEHDGTVEYLDSRIRLGEDWCGGLIGCRATENGYWGLASGPRP